MLRIRGLLRKAFFSFNMNPKPLTPSPQVLCGFRACAGEKSTGASAMRELPGSLVKRNAVKSCIIRGLGLRA